MTRAEAQALVAKLFAAYPRDWVTDETTNEVYVAAVAKLGRVQAAVAAVDHLIETEQRLPTIAAVRDEYQRLYHLFDPPALPEPEVTPEQRAENARRIRELADGIARRVDADREAGRRESVLVAPERTERVQAETNWRTDARWHLVSYDREHFAGVEPPATPPAEAELAQPSIWANLYAGKEIVATWQR